MTLLSTFLAATNFRNPFLRTLIPSIGLAYGLQAAVAVPSILAGSERFYDASGSLTYLSCTALSLFLPAIRARNAARLAGSALPSWPNLLSAFNGTTRTLGVDWRQTFNGAGAALGFNWRQVILSTAVSIWAVRRKSKMIFKKHLEINNHSWFLPLPTYHV